MAKHRRLSDKPKEDSTQHDEKIKPHDQEISSEKTSPDTKSILLSGTKYVYIAVAAALLSGVFTPLTLGVEIENVIFGMLSIFLGLGGGIVIYLGAISQKSSMLKIFGGLAMIAISLILIYEIAENSLFVWTI